MLPKFFARDACQPRCYKLTFNENGFFRTLKSIVRDFKFDKKTEFMSKVYSDLILFAIFFFAILSVKTGNFLLIILAGLFIAYSFFIGHNFLHQRDNWRKLMINFSFLSHREQRISHICSHHVFTNSFNDLEVTLSEPAISWFPISDKTFAQRYLSWIYAWLMFSFLPQIIFMQRVAISVFTDQKIFHFDDLIGFSVPVAMYFLGKSDLIDVLKCWNLILMFGGIFFGIIGITVGHHTPETTHEGDELSKNLDFGIFQLDTVVDRKDVKANQFLVLTHLGEHTLHHFFPTLDHGLLPQINDIFIGTCKEFDTELREFSWYTLLIGHHKQLARTKTLTVAERKGLR
jgi:fatty acid desaturase